MNCPFDFLRQGEKERGGRTEVLSGCQMLTARRYARIIVVKIYRGLV